MRSNEVMLAVGLDASRERDEILLLAAWPGAWLTFACGGSADATLSFASYLACFEV